MNKRTPIAATIAIGAAALLAVAFPLAASAHVTVTPNQAEPGSYTVINFRVPTESATATTTKVSIDIPADHPFASVSYVPVPGWKTDVVKTTLATPVKIGTNEITQAVTSVTWTATPGNELPSGALQLFPLSVGPVPDTGKVVLAATQTYSDGTVVAWNGGTSDAHPAPVLYINDAPVVEHDDDGDGDAAAYDETGAVASGAGTDVLARGLGIGGLVVGAVGIVIAVAATRRKASS